ncbi:MAG: class I SAM-dependent methyltransferase [Candidatus Woesearchaeota archaeon]
MKSNADYWDDFVLKNAPNSYKKWFREEKKYLQDNVRKDSTVLEVGCGNGRSINDLLLNTQKITGVDYDPKAVADAKKYFNKYKDIKIIEADATDLPFKKESFDYVICMTTFANFADKKYLALEEMKRVLKNDGRIIISVFSEDAFDERIKVYKASGVKIKKITGTTVTFDEELKANVSEQFSRQELESILSKVNLKIEEIKKINMAYILKIYK